MDRTFTQKIIQKLRENTPLFLRQKIGPIFAYIAYVLRIYVRGNPNAPKILSINETLNLILEKNLSVIRFGDGEISIINNENLGFQKKNKELAEKLKLIIQAKKSGLLICVPGIFGNLDKFTKKSFWFSLHHLFKHRHEWMNLLSKEEIYGDAFITRPYLTYKDRSDVKNTFEKLFSIWTGKEIILVEGEKSRLGVGNDMFEKAVSIQRILSPPKMLMTIMKR